MARGWSWQTRVKQMERRRIRRLIYREIDRLSGENQKTDTPAPQGTRSVSLFERIATRFLLLCGVAAAIGILFLLLSFGRGGLTIWFPAQSGSPGGRENHKTKTVPIMGPFLFFPGLRSTVVNHKVLRHLSQLVDRGCFCHCFRQGDAAEVECVANVLYALSRWDSDAARPRLDRRVNIIHLPRNVVSCQ